MWFSLKNQWFYNQQFYFFQKIENGGYILKSSF